MRKRDIFPIILVIVLCGISIYVFSNLHKSSLPKNIKSVSAGIASFEDFDFTEYAANGIDKRYSIKGKRFGVENKRFNVLISEVAKEVAIRDVEVTVYEASEPVSTILAKRAVLKASPGKAQGVALSGELDFSGDVSVITRDHKTLICDSLKWDNAKSRLYASGRCELSAEGKTVRGDTVDSDVALKDYKVERDRLKRFKELKRVLLQGGSGG